MKKRFITVVVFALLAAMTFGTVTASAFTSYETYTYSIDGEPLLSPEAYSAVDSYDSADIKLVRQEFGNKALVNANDLVSDYKGNLFIADTGNNRIVILNKYYATTAVISEYKDENGKLQTFSNPKGVFVTNPEVDENGRYQLFVCDTDNFRIVVFDIIDTSTVVYNKTIKKPETNLLKAEHFKPHAIAVDLYGRIFVVSPSITEGVLVMSNDGDFTGFIGAQKVAADWLQEIWKNFQTKEQLDAQKKNISQAFNNITVDDEGFVYVTNDNIDKSQQLGSISSKQSAYSPVKKLNSSGKEIMNRNGFFDPGGEVMVLDPDKVSNIIDVSIGREGSWTILDNDPANAKARVRLFTYDQSGNLLFAFGDKGDQLGNGENYVAMTYQNVGGVYYLVVLDKTTSTGYKITVFSPTDYCDTIMAALRNENEHNYSDSIYYWQEVLTRNNNFDLAYIGIGKAYNNQGKYEKAMEMLANAYETDNYSRAFEEHRRGILNNTIIWIIVGAIVVLWLFFKFLGYAKKRNKAATLKVGRKSYVEELLYVFHLVFHPFDGFWDLKHERRGSVRAGITIVAITVLAFFYQSVATGYVFNPRGTYSTIFMQMMMVLIPFMLFCIGNWCFTTLFDGEGSFKDIFISCSYSLAPLPLFVIISTALTNVFTLREGAMVSMLVTIGYVWVGILLFFGTLVTHDYSVGKNIISTLASIVAMMIIMFVVILFSGLVVKMVTFVSSLITEIANRAG